MGNPATFINMPSQDVYYVCQMVDRSLSDRGFAPNIEAFMGDAACSLLLGDYPKFTPLHDYIEHVVSSAIWEDSEGDTDRLLDEHFARWGVKLWVDHLLKAHDLSISFLHWAGITSEEKSVENYLLYLQQEDILPELLDRVAKEAFHVLFANRKVLRSFGDCAAYQILENAPSMYPEKFNERGYLRRAHIPQWAKDAIFHRDKGICVYCQADLTRLVNQQNALHYDHIIALAKGGMNDITNLQLLCETCNLKKSSQTKITHYKYESWYKY